MSKSDPNTPSEETKKEQEGVADLNEEITDDAEDMEQLDALLAGLRVRAAAQLTPQKPPHIEQR